MKKSILFVLLFLALGCVGRPLMIPFGEGTVKVSPPKSQVYYKNQGYSQLVEANKEMAMDHDKLAYDKLIDQENKQHCLDLSTFFVAHVLKEHPEYLTKYAQDFAKLSFYEKAIFLRGIRSAGMEHDLLNNISDKKLEKIVNDPALLTLEKSHPSQVKNCDELDYLWVSFFSTGNETYIRQILKVLNRDDELLLLAYEWINRGYIADLLSGLEGKEVPPDYADLNGIIQMKSKEKKDYLLQFLISQAAFWSLEANAKQDPTIHQLIQKIIKSKPALDYWKKINTALGNPGSAPIFH